MNWFPFLSSILNKFVIFTVLDEIVVICTCEKAQAYMYQHCAKSVLSVFEVIEGHSITFINFFVLMDMSGPEIQFHEVFKL